jgi:hypothetical protein
MGVKLMSRVDARLPGRPVSPDRPRYFFPAIAVSAALKAS